MSPDELKYLTRATCCWLAYKYLTGFESTLYERLLLIPISEFLGTIGWTPALELSYRTLFGDSKLPDHYGDIIGTRKGGNRKFILETKFLRDMATKRRSNVESDVRRLAAPYGDVERYFMLAGLQRHFPVSKQSRAPASASLFDRLLCFEYKEGFELQLTGTLLSTSPEQPGSARADKLPQFTPPVRRAYIRRCANELACVREDEKVRVILWSISRPSAKVSTN
jgi:hypothetical protein